MSDVGGASEWTAELYSANSVHHRFPSREPTPPSSTRGRTSPRSYACQGIRDHERVCGLLLWAMGSPD